MPADDPDVTVLAGKALWTGRGLAVMFPQNIDPCPRDNINVVYHNSGP